MVGKRTIIGCGMGIAALAVAVGLEATGGGSDHAPQQIIADQSDMPTGNASPVSYGQDAMPQGATPQEVLPQGAAQQGDAQQALLALAQIRRQQCQNGIQPACQGVQQIPGYEQQLARWGSACQSGDRQACGEYQNLSRRIFTAYSESAAVMREGAEGMARMDAWRGQMNANAAASMSNLQARAAAGQAAHNARQDSYAAQNRAWADGQASAERGHGRFVDGIYGGTTMDGGGVQARIPYGSTGYTDGRGNVVAVPDGGSPPDGWRPMNPTYAAPK